MPSSTFLFWSGVTFDIAGLALVSASDWLPSFRELCRAVWRYGSAAWWRVARLLGFRRTVVHLAGSGGALAFGGRVRGTVSPSPDATLDEQVAFLLRQFEGMQERLDDLETSVAGMSTRWHQDIAATREKLEERIERRLSETQEQYLTLRRVGLVCLVVAIVLLSASNL